MTNKEKVVVKINGQDFSVVGSESEEYIQGVAKLVDENIKEIMNKNSKLSQSMAAVLAALNIADKHTKNVRELKELKQNVVEPLKKFDEVKSDLSYSTNKLQELKNECDTYKDELLQSKREIERLNKATRKLEEDLRLKEGEIENLNKTMNDLQNRVFEDQVEKVQMRKELREALKMLGMD